MRNNVMSKKALELWTLPNSSLKHLMAVSEQPKNSLSNYEYRGLNKGVLAIIAKVQRFIKSFYYGTEFHINGNNFKVKQNNPAGAYIKLLKNGKPIPEGYFIVEFAKRKNSKWNHYGNAALLNYGKAKNKWNEPARFLRDYLVKPFPENEDILLGHAYFALGPFKIPFTFFVLERITSKKED